MDISKMPEAMRAEFVRAFTNQFGFGVLTASADADAASMLKAAAWAWLASREAVVVELPKQYGIGGMASDYRDQGIEECREAIEAQGLKVKL